MESCRLLVRWISRICEWAPYCSRLRSSSARLGSARRVSGVRSGGYSVCSAAPTPWSCACGGGLRRCEGEGEAEAEAGDVGRARGGCGGAAEEFRTADALEHGVAPGVEVS